jgi:hypothetical protein
MPMPKKLPVARPREAVPAQPAPAGKAEPAKRFTILLPLSLHTRIKVDCAFKRVSMADAVRGVVERAWPPGRREAT